MDEVERMKAAPNKSVEPTATAMSLKTATGRYWSVAVAHLGRWVRSQMLLTSTMRSRMSRGVRIRSDAEAVCCICSDSQLLVPEGRLPNRPAESAWRQVLFVFRRTLEAKRSELDGGTQMREGFGRWAKWSL